MKFESAVNDRNEDTGLETGPESALNASYANHDDAGEGIMPRRKRGGQRGNQNNFRHGLYALTAQKPRRLRTRGQRIKAEVLAALIHDLGGDDVISAQQRILAQLIARDLAALSQIDKAVAGLLKRNPRVWQNPAALAKLDGYSRALANSIAANVAKLGLQRIAKTLSLSDVLELRAHEQNGSDGERNQAPQPRTDDERANTES